MTLDGQATGLQTGIEALDNVFGQSDLSASLSEQEDGSFTLTGLQLRNDQLVLDGSGSIAGADVDATFDLDVADLAALGENFAGMLRAQARIDTDASTERRIGLDGTGTDISLGQSIWTVHSSKPGWR